MKRKIIVLLTVILFTIPTYAQFGDISLNIPDTNYFEIKNAMEEYWAEHPELINEPSSGYKKYERWLWFTEPRINENGTFETYNSDLKEFFQNSNRRNSQNSFLENWTPLGPFERPLDIDTIYNNIDNRGFGVGAVHSLLVNPENRNIIYAGTNGGGLWKTTDAGNNWINLTDDYPILGVKDIIFAPNDTSTIYIATGFEHGYWGAYTNYIWKIMILQDKMQVMECIFQTAQE